MQTFVDHGNRQIHTGDRKSGSIRDVFTDIESCMACFSWLSKTRV